MDGWMVFCREMGLGITLSIAVFTAFWFLLKWVLKASDSILTRMHEERQGWVKVQEGFIEQMKLLQEQIGVNMLTNKAFFESVVEAHRYQREEHKEMIATLGRINGYKS